MESLKKIYRLVAPEAEKNDDGRDKWGSRTSFVLASMGGAVGLGNLLRYPSVVFENNGLQWFIPYFLALAFLAIPILMLEISMGQAYRGGPLLAYEHIGKRAKGFGMAVIFAGYAVVTYYVAILCWVMVYFRQSFDSPLPWHNRVEEYYMDDVIDNTTPTEGSFDANGNVSSYVGYPGTGLVSETTGWCVFVWFVVWLCMFKGVGLTGRVVYFTMGLPLIVIIILIGRGASLPNAIDGIKMYMGHWDSSKLAKGDVWQAACGQIFFSVGVGFGYFISYASYNSKFSNAVQDAVIIGCCNSMVEIFAAFAVFGVIGNLGLKPEDGVKLGTFTVSFLTYPQALAEMPGAQVWSVLFFFTIMLLGISSSFALLESLVTLITDTPWGQKYSRSVICTGAVTLSFLLSLMYCSSFGFHLLNAVDTWINNVSLLFAAWGECIAVTSLYRHADIVGQVGKPAYVLFNVGYLLSTLIGLGIAQGVSAEIGAGVGFGMFILTCIASVLLAKTPDSPAPKWFSKNSILSRFWWLAFYSGHQLTRDLNVVVATGTNWSIPTGWGAVLRFISAPILSIIISFAYPAFYELRNDPLHIFAFTISHVSVILVLLGFAVPRALDIFVAPQHRGAGELPYAPNVTVEAAAPVSNMEKADGQGSLDKIETE